MKKLMVVFLAVLVAGTLVFANGVQEGKTDYPKGPVSVIVPYGAGGGTDLIARAIVESARDAFPDGIAVENRTGGGGSVGMSYGMHAKKDGQVITMVTVELVTLPHTGTGGDITYEEYEPIMMLNSSYPVIAVNKNSPFDTIDELIEAAKKENLQVGNSGIGAIWHLAAAGLCKEAGIEFTHIPFDGSAPAVTSLLGGHIDAACADVNSVYPQYQAGELKVLCALSPKRMEAFPDAPTAIEKGFDVAIGTWRGLAVPKGTPAEIVAFLEKTFTDAAATEEFKTFMVNSQSDIDILSGSDFKEKLAKDFGLFGILIKDLGLAQ